MSGRLAIIVVVVAISRVVEVGGFMEQEVSCRARAVGQMFPAYFIRYWTNLFLLWLLVHVCCFLLWIFERLWIHKRAGRCFQIYIHLYIVGVHGFAFISYRLEIFSLSMTVRFRDCCGNSSLHHFVQAFLSCGALEEVNASHMSSHQTLVICCI